MVVQLGRFCLTAAKKVNLLLVSCGQKYKYKYIYKYKYKMNV